MQFEKNIITLYGQDGQTWLTNLPNLVNQISSQWGLTALEPVSDLSYNYVLGGLQNNTPIILKLGFYRPTLQSEKHTLLAFAGNGCIKLLDQDNEQGALLLQRAVPGTPLKNLFPDQDERAVRIISRVIKDLHRAPLPTPGKLPNVSDWVATLDKDWNIPRQYLERARKLGKELLAKSIRQTVLHGDLHYENILRHGQDQWIAIDPHGAIGDPEHEVCASIRNPIPDLIKHSEAKKIILNRIHLFAELLGHDAQRIFDWSYVQGVLATCGAIEDGLDATYFINFLGVLEDMQ